MKMLTNFDYNGNVISQREDGFVNLTQMCNANGKKISHYLSLQSTKAYIQEMMGDTDITASELIEVYKGGNPQLQGTWGHPEIAIHLAQWINPKFHRWCNIHIFQLMNNGYTTINTPVIEVKQRDAIDYVDATVNVQNMADSILKNLLLEEITDELALKRNIKYLNATEQPKQWTIVKVRAKELGYGSQEIGNGSGLGKFVKSRVTPAHSERVGKYLVYHYEINNELDGAIHAYFAKKIASK